MGYEIRMVKCASAIEHLICTSLRDCFFFFFSLSVFSLKAWYVQIVIRTHCVRSRSAVTAVLVRACE